jgi:hypothetical protein
VQEPQITPLPSITFKPKNGMEMVLERRQNSLKEEMRGSEPGRKVAATDRSGGRSKGNVPANGRRRCVPG